MAQALLALGSNLGDRAAHLRAAVSALSALSDCRVKQVSSFLDTTPVGGPTAQPNYLNGVITVETALAPQALLTQCQQIELALGRERQIRWGERPIDIDIVLYDEQVVTDPRIEIPHPRMTFRRFVLEPAQQIAADWRHPLVRWTIDRLWSHWQSAATHIAIASRDRIAAQALVDALTTRVPLDILSPSVATPATVEAACSQWRSGDKPLLSPHWSPELQGLTKLVVWLDLPSVGPLTQALGDELYDGTVGPVLRLRNADVGGQLFETVAAIEALRHS